MGRNMGPGLARFILCSRFGFATSCELLSLPNSPIRHAPNVLPISRDPIILAFIIEPCRFAVLRTEPHGTEPLRRLASSCELPLKIDATDSFDLEPRVDFFLPNQKT